MSAAALAHIDAPWHDFDIEAAHRAWPDWPTEPVRPFDRDACLVAARAGRLGPDGKPHRYNKLQREWADGFARTLGVLSEEEARFWLGLVLETPFYIDERRRPTFEYFDEPFDYRGDPGVASIIAACTTGRRQHMTIVARLLRELADLDDVLDAIFANFDGRRLADWLEALGPIPRKNRDSARDHVSETFSGYTDEDWGQVRDDDVRLLRQIPEPNAIESLLRGMVRSMRNHATLPRALKIRLDPSKPLAEERAALAFALPNDEEVLGHLDEFRSARIAPNPREVGWFLLRFGPDFDQLMQLVVRRQPTGYDPDVWAELLHIHSPDFVAQFYPHSDQPDIEPVLSDWVHTRPAAARHGLDQLADGRGKRRAFALEWLAELDGEVLEAVEQPDAERREWRRWAEQHETTEEQDRDIAVPTLGLDDLGHRLLDYGPRIISVQVVGHDEVRFTDLSTGKTSSRIPTARKSDDARQVAAAKEAWAEIRPHLRKTFAEQADRLELAMLLGRSWPVDFWMSVWLEHPVLAHLARRVVWIANTEERAVAVVPSLENDFHDASYDDVDVPTYTTLTVAHTVELDVAAWAETLGELGVVQPFAQVERPALPVETKSQWEGATVTPGQIRAAISKAWQARTTGTQRNLRDQLVYSYGGVDIGLDLDPGLIGSADRRRLADEQEDQTIVEVWARGTIDDRKIPFELWPALHRHELGRLLRPLDEG